MKYYITNAIKYVNAEPHIGHGYEEIISDAIARYRRQRGDKVFLVTGLDENSINVYKRARDCGISPQEYCDRMRPVFEAVWKGLDIGYDYFVRTTDPKHHAAVKELYTIIKSKGDVFEGTYSGYYCNSCESYKEPAEITDGMCQIHKTRVQQLNERNLFFRLSRYQGRITELIKSGELQIIPDARKNELLSFLSQGLKDLSITRYDAQWGIDVPDYPGHKFYVWFDALINYLTACGYPHDKSRYDNLWPCDVHVIGKDISRFHCIIWPAMLLSAGIQLPKRVLIHGFISLHGEKLSKTTGNVLQHDYLTTKYGTDAVRYFLLRETPIGGDVDFSEEKLAERYKRDLANDLGNLVQRSLSMLKRYFPERAECFSFSTDRVSKEISALIKETDEKIRRYMDTLQISDAVSCVWDLVRRANVYVEERSPWKQAKAGQLGELEITIGTLVEAIKWTAYFAYPFIPRTSLKIFSYLGITADPPTRDAAAVQQYKISDTQILFPRLER